MNTTKPFYSHESDSRIMMKKDKAEVDNWTEDLEYINKELEYLLDIENKMVNNAELYQQMQASQRENKLRLRGFYRYGNTMRNP